MALKLSAAKMQNAKAERKAITAETVQAVTIEEARRNDIDMRKKVAKRYISLILVLVMVISMAPGGVYDRPCRGNAGNGNDGFGEQHGGFERDGESV